MKFEIDLSKTSHYPKGYFDRYIPARAVEEDGMVRNVREGFGAPTVGIRDQLPERADEMRHFPERGLHTPVTVTMDSVVSSSNQEGVTRVNFSLRNPMLEETVALGGRNLPLAADYTAPIAVVMKGRNEVAYGLEGFLKANERLKVSGIYLMEPYDSKRIPVLLIHGLVSSPYIWRDIISDMMSDPELSKRYQFMVFGYPSSFPVIESAALLRENLAAMRAKYDPDGNDPLSRNMVVAGHSMGGILTHALSAELGDNIWKQFSDKPFEHAQLNPEEKEKLRKLLFFESDPAIRRAIFFSAPHRGAKMAEKDIAGLLSKLAKLPSDVLSDTSELLDPGLADNLKIPLKKRYTSRESLEPGAPMVAAMDVSPYKPGVIYHSVIGDRGKGDTPNSSDGVVEYWSSHQAGAASELIVPSGHSSYRDPLAVEELRRILHLHVGLR
ncbi:MAG: alpha/beta fold hydrolase, partial [Verrucomicrobiales bacterium]